MARSKNDGKSLVFEKIGKAIEKDLLSANKNLVTEDGQARLERFKTAMTNGTSWALGTKDVKYGLPNIVMNCRINRTWGYPGLKSGDLWTPEYELFYSLRMGRPRRPVFFSRALLEEDQLVRGQGGLYNSFLNPINPADPKSDREFVKGVTLEVTEVVYSALFVYGHMGVLRPVTACRLRGEFAELYGKVFANSQCESILMAIADTKLQLEAAKKGSRVPGGWKMFDGPASGMPEGYATDALRAHFHPAIVRQKALAMQLKRAVWLDCLDRYVSGWDLSADAVKKDTPPGWSELHDQCPLVVELRRTNFKGKLCPGLPTVDRTPKRTIFLDFSNVKKTPICWR